MSADWSPFSSQLNWFIFMQTCNNHLSMTCQLIGQCCLSVLTNWSIFLQTFLQSPIHALSADWSALPLKVTGPLFCRVQSPMHAIYHLIGQLCLSKLSDWSIFLQTWCSQQNMQYMIWLFRFVLFSVLTDWWALLLVLSAWSALRLAYLLCICQVCRESLDLSLGLEQIGLKVNPQLCQQKIDNYL